MHYPLKYRRLTSSPTKTTAAHLSIVACRFSTKIAVLYHDEYDSGGKGSSAVSLTTPQGNSLDLKHSSIYGPGEKFWINQKGSGATGRQPFTTITDAECWELVSYINSLQKSPSYQRSHH